MIDEYDPLAVMLEAQAARVRRANQYGRDTDDWCKEMELAHRLAKDNAPYVNIKATGEEQSDDPTAELSALRKAILNLEPDVGKRILEIIRNEARKS